jgi:hypothetical protein
MVFSNLIPRFFHCIEFDKIHVRKLAIQTNV